MSQDTWVGLHFLFNEMCFCYRKWKSSLKSQSKQFQVKSTLKWCTIRFLISYFQTIIVHWFYFLPTVTDPIHWAFVLDPHQFMAQVNKFFWLLPIGGWPDFIWWWTSAAVMVHCHGDFGGFRPWWDAFIGAIVQLHSPTLCLRHDSVNSWFQSY